MVEKKGGIDIELIRHLCLFIIFLLFLFLIWITWKFLEINYEKREIIRISLLQLEKLDQIAIEQRETEIKKKKDFIIYINNLDLKTDNSLTKFVNNKIPFDDVSYIPEDLVSVSWKYIVDGKRGYITVSKILKENLEELSEQFYEDTNNNVVVVSWYRSYNYQKGIKDRGCPDNLCAKAGFSEHQSGLAIDIYSASSEKNWVNDNNLKKHFSWFKSNAHKYGFHNSYQKWLEVDWYEVEPWHWRFIWEKLATYLYENSMTIAEFYNIRNNYKISWKG